jgi:hypothetical protein
MEPLVDHAMSYFLIQLNWVALAYNFNLVNRMLITCESSISAFVLSVLLQIYLVTIPYISFIPAPAKYQS